MNPLIGRGHPGGPGEGDGRATSRARLASLAVIAALILAVFWPTLRNGFLPLGFDDAIIPDTAAIRALSWGNLYAMGTEFNQAHYVPLTMLSLALDYQIWGLNPVGYHLTNVLLHATTAVLACIFLWPIVGSARTATLATLLYAIHPMQLEAVTVAIQRKTVLSGALFFVTLILHQRWRTTRRNWYYVACFFAFVAAALAKPAVMTLPFVLLLYDYVFVDGRLHLLDKLPFVAVAGAVGLAAAGAHRAVGALPPPHGGNLLAHVLMVSRVTLEYVNAAFVPMNLSPIYYYPVAVAYAPANFLALALILSLCGYVTWQRRRYRWSFLCLWWFVLALLPESNLVPLAQLRADRFLYLALFGVALWLAIGMERVDRFMRLGRRWRLGSQFIGPVLIALLAITTHASAGIWHDNISAWSRVAQTHSWCAMAHHMLGRAYYEQYDYANAERALTQALHIASLPETHLYLAKVYAESGRNEQAEAHVQRFLELTPADPEGQELLAAIRKASGS